MYDPTKRVALQAVRYRFPVDLIEWINTEARAQGVARAVIVREILERARRQALTKKKGTPCA